MSTKVFSCIFVVVICVAVGRAQLNQALEDNPSPKHEGEYNEACTGDDHCAKAKFLYCDLAVKKTCQCMTGLDSGFGSKLDTEWGVHYGHGMCLAKEGTYCHAIAGTLACLDGLKCEQVHGKEVGVGICLPGKNGASGMYSNVLMLIVGLLMLYGN